MTEPTDGLNAALAERYAIERKLGSGGMATVWLAQDRKQQRRVALKVLRAELASRVAVERFHREIAVVARLSHPHILPLFESGEAGGALFYTMPFVTGDTLRTRLRRERQLPLEEALAITRAVAEALDYAHRQGVVHRDIKPENIMFSEGQPVVADFGIARAVAPAEGDTLTEPGVALGTVHYMSPEQASGNPHVDARADVYALGCVLYEMLAGVPPFQGATAESVLRQHVTALPPSLAAHRPDLSDSVELAVRKALAKTPVDRWSSGAALVTALTGSRVVLGARRRRAMRVAGASLVVVGALVFVASRLMPAHPERDPNLVAVAPFDVVDPASARWRDVLANSLVHNLEGAGALRAVARDTAARAGITVSGAVIPVGAESVRLEITPVDARSGRSLPPVNRRGAASDLDALLESASIELLGELGRSPLPAAGGARPFGSRSLPAVKAFLSGEQYYRRLVWDSAAAFYDEAIKLDSAFALAVSRWAQVRGLREGFPGSEALDMPLAARAGRLNHGLSARDSLLLVMDSLREALYHFRVVTDDTPFWALKRRLDATAWDALADPYRGDAEAVYRVAEAGWYWSWLYQDVNQRMLLELYDTAVALDPGFAPAYPHAIELALLERGPESAERYAAAFLALDPRGQESDDIRRVDSLLRAGTFTRPQHAPAGADAGKLSRSADWLRRWPDSGETAVRMYRAVLAGAGPDAFVRNFNRDQVARALAYRGHVHEAFSYASDYLLGDLAWLGGVPLAAATRTFSLWLRDRGLWPFGLAPTALAWWAGRRDTASLGLFVRRADSLARSRGNPGAALYGRNVATLARAYVALAAGDTTAALARFLSVPDSSSSGTNALFAADRLIKARLLEARGRHAAAAALLRDASLGPTDFRPIEALWALEWGRVNENLGRLAEARRGYRFTAAVWIHADPELQPYVEQARAALRRLGPGPGSEATP